MLPIPNPAVTVTVIKEDKDPQHLLSPLVQALSIPSNFSGALSFPILLWLSLSSRRPRIPNSGTKSVPSAKHPQCLHPQHHLIQTVACYPHWCRHLLSPAIAVLLPFIGALSCGWCHCHNRAKTPTAALQPQIPNPAPSVLTNHTSAPHPQSCCSCCCHQGGQGSPTVGPCP